MYWFQERCYKTLEDALIAYEEYKKIGTHASFCVGFGPPDIPDAPTGTIYVDIENYGEHKTPAAKDNKNITNCRNCGAPLKSCTCEYCRTRY